MKLYLDDAPDDFNLDGFEDATDADPLQFYNSPVKINVGSVATRHHAMKVAVRTRADHFDGAQAKLAEQLMNRVEDEELVDDSQTFFPEDEIQARSQPCFSHTTFLVPFLQYLIIGFLFYVHHYIDPQAKEEEEKDDDNDENDDDDNDDEAQQGEGAPEEETMDERVEVRNTS